MNSTQYRAILAALGLTQQEAADLLGRHIRAAHGYANDMKIPTTVARLLVAIAEQRLSKADFKALRLSAKDKPQD
jgi:hypothetical protein